MSSLVELLIQAVGAEQAAAAVGKVTTAQKEGTAALLELQRAYGAAKLFGTDMEVQQAKLALQHAKTAQAITTQHVPAVTRLRDSLVDLSSTIGEKLQHALDHGAGHLLALGTAALSAHAIYHGLHGALADGSHFEQLSRRTGDNIRELVVLEQGFKNAGLGADFLGRSANLLEKVLGGLDAHGGNANVTLRRLNTSVEELKPLTYAQQIGVLNEGFAKIENQSDRAAIAMKLFGRSGGELLQLFRDPQALQVAEQQAGRFADQMVRDAAKFHHLEVELGAVNLRFKEMFVSATEQLAPVLTNIAHLFEHLNLGGAGTVLGGAGLTAGGGLAALWGVSSLQMALATGADKFAGTMQGRLAEVGASFTGKLAQWLPLGLAAAVTTQIVFGIIQAWKDKEVQDVFDEARNVRKDLAPSRDRFNRETTVGGMEQQLIDAQVRLASLAGERANLQIKSDADHARIAAFSSNRRDNAEFPKLSMTEAEEKRLQELNLSVPRLAAEIVGQYANATAAAAQLLHNQVNAFNQSMAPLIAQLPELIKQREEREFKNLTPQQQLAEVARKKAELDQKLVTPPGASPEAIQANSENIRSQLAKLEDQREAAQKKIDAENKRARSEQHRLEIYDLETDRIVALAAGENERAQTIKEQIETKRALYSLSGLELDLANKRTEKEHEIWEQQQAQKRAAEEIRIQRNALDEQLTRIRENMAALDADYLRTDQEKWAQRRDLLIQEVDKLRMEATKEQMLGSLGGPNALQHQDNARRLGHQVVQGEQQIAHLGPNPNDPFAQMLHSVVQLRQSWGTTSQQIGQNISNVIGGAVQSVTTHVSGLLRRTEDWRQALGGIGLAIEESVIGALVDMGVKYVANKLLMAAADKGIAAAQLALLAPIATATALLWAPAATAATIATFGGAAAAAPAEIASANAITMALFALPVARSGGYFPGQDDQIAGVFHGNEFIYSAPAVRALGPEFLASQHAAALRGGAPAAAGSASSSAGVAGDAAPNVHIYFDRKAWMRAVASDVRGIAHEVYDQRARS